MDAADEYQLEWYIDNYSYLPWDIGWLESPKFNFEGFEKTSWCLGLNPAFLRVKGFYSLFLKRSCVDAGPETFSLKLEISIITVYGSTLYTEQSEPTFRKGEERYFRLFVDMDELIVRRNTNFLPRDTLGVSCKMWRGEGRPQKLKKYTTRTIIRTEEISFVHKIGKFSNLETKKPNTIQIPSRLEKGCIFSSDLWISRQDSPEGSIHFSIRSSNDHHRVKRKKFSLISVSGEMKTFYVDYRFQDADEKEEKIFGYFTKMLFIERRQEFLPNDELTLICECIFYTGEESSIFREILQELHEAKDKGRDFIPHSKIGNKAIDACPIASEHLRLKSNCKDKPSKYPGVTDDLKALYLQQLLTDVELKTETNSFSAHKLVLCIQSHVFCSILTDNLEVKNIRCIQVEGLEDETVHQLLLFLYSDSLENLQWESALKLYYAADKYALESLKNVCSSVLVDNLNTSNASEILLLADRHSDTLLKELVEDFIFAHDTEVFGSDEWEKFNECNPQLASKTMLLKYKRNKAGK